jgi:ABC-type antimicrobial peptide transport system permease subunit
MALGAQRSDILQLIVGQGVRITLIGISIGVAAALALTRFLSSLLFGVSATDPLTFGLVAVSLALLALVACWIPARRPPTTDHRPPLEGLCKTCGRTCGTARGCC